MVNFKFRYGEYITSLLLILFPVSMLNLQHAANFIYLSIFLICIFGFLPKLNFGKVCQSNHLGNHYFLMLSFLIYPTSILISSFLIGGMSANGFDAPSRFLMAAPILFTLLKVEFRNLRWAYFSAILGAWVGLVEASYQIFIKHQEYAMTYFTWPSNFGDLVLILGILSLGFYRDSFWKKILAISGLFAALTCSYLSQSRGSWMAIVFMALTFIFLWGKNKFKLTLLLIVIGTLFYFSVPRFQARVNLGWYELTSPLTEVSDSSVGLRRQFWKASILLIEEHPLLGVGRFKFGEEKASLVKKGILSPAAIAYSHPHNELLYAQVESGIMGFIGILTLYLGPLIYFLRQSCSTDEEIRLAARLGIMIVASYFIFGLVDVMLVAWVMEAPVYVVSVMIPILIINSRKIFQNRDQSQLILK